MASHKARRINKELADIKNDPASMIEVDLIGDSITRLKGRFDGPPDTPYAGGKYEVDITIPNEYPFKPPVMKFITKIWHPNVSSQTGAICLDVLKDQWSPVLTLKSAMISLQSLLNSPEPKDPQDAIVAAQMIQKPKQFELTAKQWTVQYAGGPKSLLGDQTGGSSAADAEGAEDELDLQRVDSNEAYDGYPRRNIDRFVEMGFARDRVVEAFNFVGIDRNGGVYYELEEAYSGDILARIMGEP